MSTYMMLEEYGKLGMKSESLEMFHDLDPIVL